MDPNACLERFLKALDDSDAEEAYQAHLDLSRWLADGGFEPADKPGLELFRKWTRLPAYTSVGSYPLLYLHHDRWLCPCCASMFGASFEDADILWENEWECDECNRVVEPAYPSPEEIADERSPEDVYNGVE